jgi:hypothetical protein
LRIHHSRGLTKPGSSSEDLLLRFVSTDKGHRRWIKCPSSRTFQGNVCFTSGAMATNPKLK